MQNREGEAASWRRVTGLLFGHQWRDTPLGLLREFLRHASRRLRILSLKGGRRKYSAENFFFLARVISRFIVPRFVATQVFLPVERSYWLEWPNMAEPHWLAQMALCLDFKDSRRGKNTF